MYCTLITYNYFYFICLHEKERYTKIHIEILNTVYIAQIHRTLPFLILLMRPSHGKAVLSRIEVPVKLLDCFKS